MIGAATSVCLSHVQLEALASGALVDSRHATLHIAGCDRCRRLLESIQADNSLLGQAAALNGTGCARSDDSFVGSVDGYRLLDEIHRGAQGVVYRAEQTATRRIVAIKLLHHGAFASAVQRRRFEQEVEIVANLRHPHVVTVYESGRTRNGGFYVAMEYIHAKPLRTLDVEPPRTRAAIREILKRFVQLCEAVNAAHQRGIIHRDLKPANILIDEAGEPHVLDFGIARRERGMGAAEADQTVAGQFVGTFAYAAPEQVQGDPRELDIRCDVYALGVILFEWLTARRPLVMEGGLGAIVETIRHTRPPAVSTCNAVVPPDLEAALARALEKDRTLRYQSAGSLADDVRRVIEGRPIEARSGQRWYIARKFITRHWLATGAVATLVATLSIFSAAVTILWRDAAEANTAKGSALAALVNLFGSDAPLVGKAEPETVKEFLRDAETTLRGHLADQPDAWKTFLELGTTQLERSDYEAALRQFNLALTQLRARRAGDHPDIALALHYRGRALFALGRLAEAERCYRDALATFEQTYGHEHDMTATTTGHLAATLRAQGRMEEARGLYLDAIDIRRHVFGERDRRYAEALNNYGYFLLKLGEHANALKMFESTLAIVSAGDLDPVHVATVRNNMAACLLELGRLGEAREQIDSALSIKLAERERNNRRVLVSLHLRACLLEREGRMSEALAICDEVLAARRGLYPSGHTEVDESQALRDRLVESMKLAESVASLSPTAERADGE